MDGTDWDFLHFSPTTPPNLTLQKIFSPRSFLASRLVGGGCGGRTVFLKVVFGIS